MRWREHLKVVLISTDESPAAMGVKALSSNLIKRGFETSVVVMANWDDDFKGFNWDDLKGLCRGASLVGISCMTHGARKAAEVKRKLRESLDMPVVVGGVHATLDPESLLTDFELVYRGEGEDGIVQMAEHIKEGRALSGIPGLWSRDNGSLFKNAPEPLSKDLNDYPFPDYDLSHQYILESNRILPMELNHIVRDYFEVIGSRGCPHTCAFCSNFRIKQDFPWRSKVRQYDNSYFIEHLKEILRLHPVVKSFWLEDDTFFAKDYAEIKEFSDRYKSEVNKPFCILISPWTYSEEKVKLLVDAGMDRLIMGVQSGSENTNHNIYSRRIANARMFEIIRSLNKFQGMMPYYDFIGMNPFETREDLLSTIRFVRGMPAPFFIFSNNLAFYPGTRILERAIEEGLDISGRDRHTDAKHGYAILRKEKIKHKLFHLVFLMMGGKANKFKIGLLPRFMLSEGALKLYSFVDSNLSFFSDSAASALSGLMILTDWKYFLKKRLSRRQIEGLKKVYHRFFK